VGREGYNIEVVLNVVEVGSVVVLAVVDVDALVVLCVVVTK